MCTLVTATACEPSGNINLTIRWSSESENYNLSPDLIISSYLSYECTGDNSGGRQVFASCLNLSTKLNNNLVILMSTFCILCQGDQATQKSDELSCFGQNRTQLGARWPPRWEDWWMMIFREQRQQTGGDNRSHALVTEVSCVTRSSWQSRDNSGSNLVSIIGSFLGVKGQHYYCLIVKIKSQENTNSQTAQDNGQTSVNINRQTSVSASAAPGHLGTGASVLPARAFSLTRHLTQTWYWVRDLDWMSLDNVCMAPVTWPLLCPAGGGVSILCVF